MMTEESQHINTDIGRQPPLRCNISADGSKAELMNRLEIYWGESEKDYVPQGQFKGKSVEQTQPEGHEKRDGLPTQESTEGQNYALLSYMENRLEEKIEEKLGESLARVLDKSLQQWSAQLNRSSSGETHFPSKKFKKTRDQHEYDAICD
ncbi:11244_t:CDS:2, partial [Racocetra persica]